MKKAIVLLTACLISSLLYANHYVVTGTQSERCGIVASILIDEQFPEFGDNELELGVFCGDECRASFMAYEFTKTIPNGTVIAHFFRADPNVVCDFGDILSFKLWNHRDEVELETSTTLVARQDGYGTMMNPQVLNFTSPTPPTQTYELVIPAYGAGNTGGYHLISSPVTAEIEPSATNGFISGNYDLYYFDQTQELEWINFEAGAFAIESGKGYLYANETGTTLQFTGTAYNGTGVIDLEYYTSNPDNRMHGWNLIGNPFPQTATVNKDYYALNDNGDELITKTGAIPAMNGIFVKAAREGETVTFTPGNGGNKDQIVINVLKDRSATIDRAIVRFDENSILPKFMLDSNNTKVYIPESGESFAVVSSSRQNSLPVNFKAKESGSYTLSVDINNIEMEYLHLIDNMTGADIDLLQQPYYQFNATTHDYEARFTLVFRAETGVQEQGQESFCFVNGRSLYFCEDVEGATLSLVDMTGRMVSNETLKGNGVSLANLSEGVYVVRLAKGNDVKVQKIVVR